jgi:hypothetical protein
MNMHRRGGQPSRQGQRSENCRAEGHYSNLSSVPHAAAMQSTSRFQKRLGVDLSPRPTIHLHLSLMWVALGASKYYPIHLSRCRLRYPEEQTAEDLKTIRRQPRRLRYGTPVQ